MIVQLTVDNYQTQKVNRILRQTPRAVIATTPHSFKGYEKELVLLVGVHAFAEEDRTTTLYVAMTRARSLLALYGWDRPLAEVQSLFSTVRKCLARLTN